MSYRTGKVTGSTVRAIDDLMQEWQQGKLSRRSVLQRAAALGLTIPALAAMTSRAGSGRASAAVLNALQDDPASGTTGGILKIGTIGEAPHLDEHQTTAGVVAEVTYPAYETLFTYDTTYQAVPQLVGTHTVSEDGMTHTMALRKGVKFHNGEEMKAADAIASIERWGRISGVGKRIMEKTTSITANATDEHTFDWVLTQPYGTILIALAHNTQACTIHPKSVLDTATDDPMTDVAQYIGTGPYKIVEWRRDSVLRLERFADYTSSSEVAGGYGGKKFAYADAIEFYPVPDEAARVAGLQAGDYHMILDVGNDQYEVLKDYEGVIAEILPPTQWDVMFCNWKSPMMSNLAMRQAVQLAMDPLPQLQSGRGGGDFIRLDPGLMMQQTAWYTKAGEEFYNIYNPDAAKAKLTEAGYAGEPLRFMCTQEYSYMYGEAIVAKQQLEDVGITVDFQVTDWATVLENRAKPEAWEMFVTGHGFVPDPSQISYIGQMNVYPGWWDSETSLALAADLLSESDFDTRYGLFEQLQSAAYTEIPAVKVGDSSVCSFRSDKLGGWDGQFERGQKYWNFWIKS